MPQATLTGLEEVLQARDIHISLALLQEESLNDRDHVTKFLRTRCVDGFLIGYNAALPKRFEQILEANPEPIIWLNSKHRHDCVYPDDYDAGRMAARHLLELGHRNTSFVFMGLAADPGRCPLHEAPLHYSGPDLYKGYATVVKSANLIPHSWVGRYPMPRNQIIAHLTDLLTQRNRPTAIVCYSVHIAVQAYVAAMSLGFSVPADLSIITFVGENPSHTPLPLTCLRLPEFKIGCVAGETILAKMDQPDTLLRPRKVPFDFDNSEPSTAKPPKRTTRKR